MIYDFLDRLSSRRKADKTYRVENLVEKHLEGSSKTPHLPIINLTVGQIETPIHIAGLYTLLGFNPKTDADIADQLPSNLSLQGEHIGHIEIYRSLLDLGKMHVDLGGISKKWGIDNPREYIKESYGNLPGDYNTLSFDQSGNKLFKENLGAFIGVMSEILTPFLKLDRNNQIKYLRELEGIKKSNRPSILVVGALASELGLKHKRYVEVVEHFKDSGNKNLKRLSMP